MRWQLLSSILGNQDEHTDQGSDVISSTDTPTILLDDELEVSDQIPAHTPALPVSIRDVPKKYSTIPDTPNKRKKRTWVPFDAETTQRRQEVKSRHIWVTAVVMSIAAAALTIGLSVGLSHPHHPARKLVATSGGQKHMAQRASAGQANNATVTGAANSTSIPADGADAATIGSTSGDGTSTTAAPQAANNTVIEEPPLPGTLPGLSLGSSFLPAPTEDTDVSAGASIFETVNWYQVTRDAQLVNSKIAVAVISQIINKLHEREVARDPNSKPLFEVSKISSRTLWMYVRDNKLAMPNLYSLLRDYASDPGKEHAVPDEVIKEMQSWINESAISMWIQDFWAHHDRATNDIQNEYLTKSDTLVRDALHELNAVAPEPSAGRDPYEQLQHFVATYPNYASPVADGMPTQFMPYGGGGGGGGRRLQQRGIAGQDSRKKHSSRKLAGDSAQQGRTAATAKPFGAELEASNLPHIQIPLVFHVMCYMENGFQQPAAAYWDDYGPYYRLAQLLNTRFKQSGVNVSVHIDDVRNNCTQYSYLNMGNFNQWQECAASGCSKVLGPNYNQDPEFYINVWVGGTKAAAVAGGECPECDRGYTWTAPFSWTEDPKNSGAWDQQHIFMSWDAVDPAVYNNADSWEYGGWLLAHMVGEYLGLRQTGGSSCFTAYSDLVTDTPVSKMPALSGWYLEADRWCSDMRDTGVLPAQAPHFDSCAYADKYMDPIFSLMSRGPLPCSLFLTPGQSYMLHAVMSSYRHPMYITGQPHADSP